jgi:hypothetical protein
VRIRLIILTVITLFLSSCFKEDDKVILSSPGDAQISTVTQGPDYDTQIFFDLNNKEILTNPFEDWDLAFESSSSGYHIFINNGKNMLVSNSNSTAFFAINDTLGSVWKWDASTGNTDSTAIGNWVNFIPVVYPNPKNTKKVDEQLATSLGATYIIDRGSVNSYNRFKKVVFQTVNEESYIFKYSNLDNSELDSIVLIKNINTNFTYFTFENGGSIIDKEPNKKDWDLLFTRYKYIFYSTSPFTPYVVSGVLLNPNNTYAGVDSLHVYEDINYTIAKTIPLTSNRDIIGFAWKKYDFTTQSYQILPNRNYIIRDSDGYYWKLKFHDFYTEQGEKGSPKFEYQRL